MNKVRKPLSLNCQDTSGVLSAVHCYIILRVKQDYELCMNSFILRHPLNDGFESTMHSTDAEKT